MTEGLMSTKFYPLISEGEDYLNDPQGGGNRERNNKAKMSNVNLEFHEDEDRMRRFALLHQQREEEMEGERQRRLQVIEEVRLISLSLSTFLCSAKAPP
jgi:hypothetical protein